MKKISFKISGKKIMLYFYFVYFILIGITVFQFIIFVQNKIYKVVVSDGKTLLLEEKNNIPDKNNFNVARFEKIIKHIEEKTTPHEHQEFKNIFN